MSKQEEAPKADREGRDSKGRFTRGNLGGPGNPYARQVADLRAELAESTTREEIREIADALKAKARAGDVPAARLLFQYIFGKPVEAAHPDRLDQDEVAAFRSGLAKAELEGCQQWSPASPFLFLLRHLLPAKGGKLYDQMSAHIDAQVEAERDAAEKKAATVNKRRPACQSATVNAPKGVPPAQTESIRLVNLPDDDPAAPDKRAANPPR